MSVVKGKREQGKLQVLELAMTLSAYTLNICKNEKVFPKSYRWLLTQKIVNETIEAQNCIRRANAIRLPQENTEFGRKSYEYRLTQQNAAYAHYEALLGMIDLAFNALSISSDRVEYWTGCVVEVEDKLRAWAKADKKRVSKVFGKED